MAHPLDGPQFAGLGIIALLTFSAAVTAHAQVAPETRESLSPPLVQPPWIRPAPTAPTTPVWGHAAGLQVGLAPLPGPRGLLRIYTPYLGQPPRRMLNFIAIEPIVEGQTRRGYSELEPSDLDSAPGSGSGVLIRRRIVNPNRPNRPQPVRSPTTAMSSSSRYG